MFERLKQRWQVNALNLALVLLTFAIGGSLCGFACRKLLNLTGMEKGFLWVVLYIILITALWPICVLTVSIPFGQFSFFLTYLKKIRTRMSGRKKSITSVAIFASGAGSNAEKIIQQANLSFNERKEIFRVDLIISNKMEAGVLEIAARYHIKTLIIEKERFIKGDAYVNEFKNQGIEFLILAGFLWKVPLLLIRAYPNKIVNIHPALLPKYGGKGMYGERVHAAIIAAGEKESGITIHYVDELYDHGNIIFQAKCKVEEYETPDTLAQKIHLLEHHHYPKVIEGLLQMQNSR
ncbi:MAG: phosphoribosylglycinamide formyltransferase [Ferruginibacter sp.]